MGAWLHVSLWQANQLSLKYCIFSLYLNMKTDLLLEVEIWKGAVEVAIWYQWKI